MAEAAGDRSAARARERDRRYLISRESRTREKLDGKRHRAPAPCVGEDNVVARDLDSEPPRRFSPIEARPGRKPRPGKSDGAGRREARRRGRPVAAPRGFFPDPRARFYSAHGKQFCPIINRAIVGGWLYARGAFHTSECNGNQIERRRARGLSAGVKTR